MEEVGQQDPSLGGLVLASGEERVSIMVKSSTRTGNSEEVGFGFQAL